MLSDVAQSTGWSKPKTKIHRQNTLPANETRKIKKLKQIDFSR